MRIKHRLEDLKFFSPFDRIPDTFSQSALERRAPTPADRRGHFEALTHQRWSKPEPWCSSSTLRLIPGSSPSPLCSRLVHANTEPCKGIHSLLYATVNGSEWEIERLWEVFLCHRAIWFSCLHVWMFFDVLSRDRDSPAYNESRFFFFFGSMCEPSQLSLYCVYVMHWQCRQRKRGTQSVWWKELSIS